MNTKLQALKNAVTSKAGRQVLEFKKQSPHIMFGAGVVGVVATVVLASKATLQLEEILDETDEKMAQAKGLRDAGHPQYSENDYKSDMVKLYVRQGVKISKLYGPAFVVGAVSVGCLTGAHVTLTKRNSALMAAYVTVDKAFRQYRDRVLADVGEEKDREYRFGTQEISEKKIDKNGKVKETKRVVAGGTSLYSKFFDETNPNWSAKPENVMFFLRLHSEQLNNNLQARGHVFLNEVYDCLGMPRTTEGQVVGWLKDNPNGDGFIDFGIWEDGKEERILDFMTGRENCILLDFNVDGIIYEQI